MEYIILKDIVNTVLDDVHKNDNQNYSLLGGDLGQSIFLYFAASAGLCKYSEANYYLKKILDSVRSSPIIHTYCNGIAGLCVGLTMLERYGFIEGVTDSIPIYDENLTQKLKYYLNGNFDFLHGAVGIGMYFADRSSFDNTALKNTQSLLNRLYETHLSNDDGGIYWFFPKKEGPLEQNLSISHGISSVVIFLVRAYKHLVMDKSKERCINLLNGIGQYIKSNLKDPSILGCYTPMLPHYSKSRLGWCYGDIGTSIALRAIGETIGNSELLEMSNEIALHIAIHRQDLNSNAVYDAGLCHGSAGIAHFFYNCMEFYNDSIFKDSYNRWRRITLDMYDYPNKMFGCYKHSLKSKCRCLNLLEGDTGIALMLMKKHDLINNLLIYEY